MKRNRLQHSRLGEGCRRCVLLRTKSARAHEDNGEQLVVLPAKNAEDILDLLAVAGSAEDEDITEQPLLETPKTRTFELTAELELPSSPRPSKPDKAPPGTNAVSSNAPKAYS
jgi:hypothetical protein